MSGDIDLFVQELKRKSITKDGSFYNITWQQWLVYSRERQKEREGERENEY